MLELMIAEDEYFLVAVPDGTAEGISAEEDDYYFAALSNGTP